MHHRICSVNVRIHYSCVRVTFTNVYGTHERCILWMWKYITEYVLWMWEYIIHVCVWHLRMYTAHTNDAFCECENTSQNMFCECENKYSCVPYSHMKNVFSKYITEHINECVNARIHDSCVPYSYELCIFTFTWCHIYVTSCVTSCECENTSFMCAASRRGGLGSRPKKMYGKRLGDGVEYHLMSPTPRC